MAPKKKSSTWLELMPSDLLREIGIVAYVTYSYASEYGKENHKDIIESSEKIFTLAKAELELRLDSDKKTSE